MPPAPHLTCSPGRCTTCSTAQLGTGSRWPQLPPPTQPGSVLFAHIPAGWLLASAWFPPLYWGSLGPFPALRYESTPRVTEQGKRVLQGPRVLGRAYLWTNIDSEQTESL